MGKFFAQARCVRRGAALFSWVAIAVTAAAVLASGAGTARANDAVFVVNETLDAIDADPGDGNCDDGGGDCTLRAAIMEANAHAGADTIQLAAGEEYTLTIAGTGTGTEAGDLNIHTDITILGDAGSPPTIDASVLGDRVFAISDGATVSMSDLIIMGGDADADQEGGGIAVFRPADPTLTSVLTLTSVTVADNSATRGGGISLNQSTLTGTDLTVTGNTATGGEFPTGGGIWSFGGTVSLVGGELSHNSARGGGGLWSGMACFGDPLEIHPGSAMLDGVNVYHNDALTFGGGLANQGSLLTVQNGATISQNSVTDTTGQGSGGGIFSSHQLCPDGSRHPGTLTVSGSNISFNSSDREGGGVANLGSPATISTSVISDNTVAGVGGHAGGGGLANHSFAMDGDELVATRMVTDSEISGNGAANRGNGLRNLGGDVTLTNVDILDNDELSGGLVPDHQGGGIANETLVRDTVVFPATLDMMGGSLSGNSSPTCDRFGAGGGLWNFGATASLTDVHVSLNSACSGPGLLNSRHVNLDLGIDLDAHLTVVGGQIEDNSGFAGGGLENSGDAHLDGTTISRNETLFGAGIFNTAGGVLDAHGVTIDQNVASASGGGLLNFLAQATLTDSSVTANMALGTAFPDSPANGAGIWNIGSALTLNNTTVSGNTLPFDSGTPSAGGGINSAIGAGVLDPEVEDLRASTVVMTGGELSANSADRGGGLYNSAADRGVFNTATLDGVLIADNTANIDGGGVFNAEDGVVDVSHSAFLRNMAPNGEGGALYSTTGAATIVFSAIVDNIDLNGDAVADGDISAVNNWWGCSDGPGADGCDTIAGPGTFDPWLSALEVSPETFSGQEGTPATASATLFNSSEGSEVDGSGLFARFDVPGTAQDADVAFGSPAEHTFSLVLGANSVVVDVLFAGVTAGLSDAVTYTGTGAEADSDGDSNLPPDYLDCQGPCPGGYFNDVAEAFMGTDPFDRCPPAGDGSFADADVWPPDFNGTGSVNLLDVFAIRPVFGTASGDGTYLARFDLNASGNINLLDVFILRPFFGLTCTLPS